MHVTAVVHPNKMQHPNLSTVRACDRVPIEQCDLSQPEGVTQLIRGNEKVYHLAAKIIAENDGINRTVFNACVRGYLLMHSLCCFSTRPLKKTRRSLNGKES